MDYLISHVNNNYPKLNVTINYFDMREIASAESKQFIKEHYDVCGYYYLELFLW